MKRALPKRDKMPQLAQLQSGEEQVRKQKKTAVSAAVGAKKPPPLSAPLQVAAAAAPPLPQAACRAKMPEEIPTVDEPQTQETPCTLRPTKKKQRSESTIFRQCCDEMDSFCPKARASEDAALFADALRRGETLACNAAGLLKPCGGAAEQAESATLLRRLLTSLWVNVDDRDAEIVSSDDPDTRVVGTGTFAVVLGFSQGKTHAALTRLLALGRPCAAGGKYHSADHPPLAVRVPKPAAPGQGGELCARAALEEAALTHFCASNGLGPRVHGVHFARCRDVGSRPRFFPMVVQEQAAESWCRYLRTCRTAFAGAEAACKTLLLLARAAKADVLCTDAKLNNMLLLTRGSFRVGGRAPLTRFSAEALLRCNEKDEEETSVCLCDFDPQFILWNKNATGSAAGRLLVMALLVCAHAKNDGSVPPLALAAWQEKFAAVINGLMGMDGDAGVQWVRSFQPRRLLYSERTGSDPEQVRLLLLMMCTSYFYGQIDSHDEKRISHLWPHWDFSLFGFTWATQMRDFALS